MFQGWSGLGGSVTFFLFFYFFFPTLYWVTCNYTQGYCPEYNVLTMGKNYVTILLILGDLHPS